METKDPIERVHELLEEDFWIPTLETHTPYSRIHDDNDGDFSQQLTVIFSMDGDAWVNMVAPDNHSSLRFRMPLAGGGMSKRTRVALMILAEAIRLDNEEKPQDWLEDR